MKLTTMFLIIIAIQINLLIFDSQTSGTTYTPISVNGTQTANVSSSALFEFVSNPSGWSDSLFITLFGLTALSLVGAAAIGSVFFKSDIIVFAPLVAVIITWLIPITSLWNLIYRETDLFGTSAALFATVITAPLVIIAIFSVIAWWRGNSELA